MAKMVSDILRAKRREATQQIERAEQMLTRLIGEIGECCEDITKLRQLHTQLGASIQILDGDSAPLDLPPPGVNSGAA